MNNFASKPKNNTLEETTLRILRNASKFGNPDELTPEDVVAKIQTMSSHPGQIRLATGSLTEALQDAADFPEFDLDVWQKEWTAVEREMKTITRTNAIAEGRREMLSGLLRGGRYDDKE